MRNNIVTAIAGDKLYIKTDSVFQYDYGLKLVISGVELPQEYDVHFSNTHKPSAKTSTGDSTGVVIPDEYLLSGEDVHAWIYLHTGNRDTDGESIYHIHIPVIARAAIAEEQITPVEHNVIREALEKIEEAVAETEANVEKYPYVSETGYWMVYDAELGEFVNTGEKAVGFSPVATVVKEGAVATITVTDENGTTTAEVYDGAALIDDTAGAGDTDKSWSADKLTSELNLKAPKADPVFTGSISLGRKSGTTVGSNSVALGSDNEASGMYSFAEGSGTKASAFAAHTEGGGSVASGVNSHAEGSGTTASQVNAHAEGAGTTASSVNSHAEGAGSQASGAQAHAEGTNTISSGVGSHAEGMVTNATAVGSHSEGITTTASGSASHAEGYHTTASGDNAHSEGTDTIANHKSQHVSGEFNVADDSSAASTARGNYVEIIGNGTSNNERSNARTLDWSGNENLAGSLELGGSISINRKAGTTVGANSVAVGYNGEASGQYSFAEGNSSKASGHNSHAEGASTIASGHQSHAEGGGTTASGYNSHAEGSGTTASGNYSHAEGSNTQATETNSHAEGSGAKATNQYAHAEGGGTTASGVGSHAEGGGSTASGANSHAEGGGTFANGAQSHAEGGGSVANGEESHAEGLNTIASHRSQHVFGEYNVADTSTATSSNRGNYVEIIGNGTASNSRSNARTLDWNGNERLKGDLYVGCDSDSTGGSKVLSSSDKGVAEGLATLDANGKVPTSQLPSYVDDVVEVETYSALPQTGESGKIYVTLDTNKTYRWTGSTYVEISASLALGETESTAYRGDRGKAAYDHASAKGSAYESGMYKITTNSEGHVTSATAVVKSDITDLGIPGSIPVSDVQIDGTTIVGQGEVANIPLAGSNTLGVVKTDSTYGVETNASGRLNVSKASSANIKAGTNAYKPITPVSQHEAAFYGLAKAAGQDMASSANAVGTYTTEAQAAIRTMIGAGTYSKPNTGIPSTDMSSAVQTSLGKADAAETAVVKTYTTTMDATVTTVNDGTHYSPYASYAGVTLLEPYKYRITVDGVATESDVGTWQESTGSGQKGYRFVGNLGLKYENPPHIIVGEYDKPYCLYYRDDLDVGLQILTSTAGEHTIKIERITYSKSQEPATITYGNNESPLRREYYNGSGYQSIQLGPNASEARGTLAFGHYNDVQKEFGIAIGMSNTITGQVGAAIGALNTAGQYAFAEGTRTTASGRSSHAEGELTTASGSYSHAEGGASTASGSYAHAEGYQAQASAPYTHAEGVQTKATANLSHAEGYLSEANAVCAHAEGRGTKSGSVNQHVQGAFNVNDSSDVYADIIGNGTADDARSNAFALKWTGEGRFAGDVYVGCNSDSTGGTRLPHDVQVNGTSIVQNGVANVPPASTTDYGVLKVGASATGLQLDSSGYLKIAGASSTEIKDGTNYYRPIVPATQANSTFYGLAAAAGDTTQKNSSNAVGIYTDDAKSAIRSMIGAENGADLIKVQDTQPTDAMIWLPETPPSSVQVPTYSEFQALETTVGGKVSDVQVYGTSVVTSGVANIPVASGNNTNLGVCKFHGGDYGIGCTSAGIVYGVPPTDAKIKAGINTYSPITASVQDKSVFYGLAKAAGDSTQASSDNAVGIYTADAKSAIQTMLGVPGDVQVNGTSVVGNGVANVPIAGTSLGVVKKSDAQRDGINISSDGSLITYPATDASIKSGGHLYQPITPGRQEKAVFYGLSKVAGVDLASQNVTLGTYPETSKTAIRNMLGVETGTTLVETVSGTTPAITAAPNVRYNCGEVSTIDITPPSSGTCDIFFTSGSTAAILTVPNTVKFPAWFDATALDTNTIYEIMITDATYGSVMTWAS